MLFTSPRPSTNFILVFVSQFPSREAPIDLIKKQMFSIFATDQVENDERNNWLLKCGRSWFVRRSSNEHYYRLPQICFNSNNKFLMCWTLCDTVKAERLWSVWPDLPRSLKTNSFFIAFQIGVEVKTLGFSQFSLKIESCFGYFRASASFRFFYSLHNQIDKGYALQ